MNTNIFIPEKIKVGYQNRTDTYTNKLAYVIYWDNKKVLRKEASWNSWRDSTIDADDFDNTPIEGFVLNKKVGGNNYSWNPRNTYCRIYDPRGFEFEISIPNLLYILENTNSIKGKGLEGKFVYGWSGTELVLVPESAPEYTQMVAFTKLQENKVGAKDMTPGWKYLTAKNEEVTYMGKFDTYERFLFYSKEKQEQKLLGKKYWFRQGGDFYFVSSLSTIKSKLEEDKNFVYLYDKLEEDTRFSKVKEVVWDKTAVTVEDLMKRHLKDKHYHRLYLIITEQDGLFFRDTSLGLTPHFLENSYYAQSTEYYYNTFEEAAENNRVQWTRLDYTKPHKIYQGTLILENGKQING